MFVHLRVHSEYSIIDSIITLDDLIGACVKNNMPAIAITDQSNLFAAIKFYKAAQSAGLKPILGSDVFVKDGGRITLICQNNIGYRNLTQLISRSYLEGQTQEIPEIDYEWLAGHTDGLICIAHLKNYEKYHDFFKDRFYLELQRIGKPNEEAENQEALDFAHKFNLPIVATNNVRFLSEEDFEAHEARVCIHDGYVLNDAKRPKKYTHQQYLRTAEEMVELFADIPEAIENTLEIAKRCNLKIELGKVYLPQFPIPEGYTIESYLSEKSNIGLEKRLNQNKITDTDVYRVRLKTELDVINPMGFAGYFLIVADFIQWAKDHNIPVGPGRGSGAGSIVAYALGITDIDPIPYDLLFERFLNPERVSMPDFDIDFCMDNRDRVIEYVAEKYGRESVSQIITYGTMAAKAVVRDVGRVLGHPYGFVDKLAKLIPFELGITLDKALEQEADLKKLYETEEEVKILFDLAKKLEGITRNAGKHAGGVVIAPSKLTDFTPLYCEPQSQNLVSQFDKNDIEEVGLVKFDFLGLRTLTIMAWAIEELDVDLNQLPVDDVKTFELIKACQTTAVFQLESRGMKDLVKRLQPDNFEEIIALVALFRPGPLQSGMVEDFINRKHGRAKVHYFHPDIEPILKPTYGVIVYQEQVMQIAQVLAGYTLGSADLLRRAMGKKKAEEMAQQREIFVNGAKARGVAPKIATDIFDLMEKFAGYGFNKSHSAAYALISYQTAWLKTHYPAQFMAAVLSSDMDNTDKVVIFLQESKNMNLKVLPPDINKSFYKFKNTPEGEIIYGLGAIKGAGEAAISLIVEDRKLNGPFKDLFDFVKRFDSRKVNRRVLESFIKAGALDSLGLHRAQLMANLDSALQSAEQNQSAKKQQNLFGEIEESHLELLPAEKWPMAEQLQYEKDILGVYISGHPLESHEAEFKDLLSDNLKFGVMSNFRTMFTKRGDRMAFLGLDDGKSVVDVTIFSEVFEKNKELLTKDTILIIEGDMADDDFTGGQKLLARNIYNLDTFREKFAKVLLINIKQGQVVNVNSLTESIRPFKSGTCPVYIEYEQKDKRAKIQLGSEWKVKLQDKLLEKLRVEVGVENIKVCY
ncbi:MAG TPA: DNA polymerase III subunit alpha [Gammaproteobacteria bacterium]|nr:DNA polymerase III subunit alpha [Gammaproteobacteria bacterium]